MRKHLYLIIDHPDDERVGQVEITGDRKPVSEKNSRTPCDMHDLDTGERWSYTVVSMGYVDYDGTREYKQQIGDDVVAKLDEIDADHLIAAGLDPDEVLGGAA